MKLSALLVALALAVATPAAALPCCAGTPVWTACDAAGVLFCEYVTCTELGCRYRLEAWFDCAVCSSPPLTDDPPTEETRLSCRTDPKGKDAGAPRP